MEPGDLIPEIRASRKLEERPLLRVVKCRVSVTLTDSSGSSGAETRLVSVTRSNVGRGRHCGTSIIGLPVSFLDLSFERTGPVWSRVDATGHQLS
jgi:hypothetical protein